MATATWDDTNELTAVSGCTESGGTVTLDPFDDADIPNANAIIALSLDETTGNFLDALGSDNGTPTNVTRVNVKKNGGASMEGTGKISLPQNAVTGTKGSVTLWCKIDTGNTYEGLFSFGGSNDASVIRVDCRNNEVGTMRLRIGQTIAAGPTYNYFYGSTNFSFDELHFVALTSDGSTWKLYLDGVLQTLTIVSGSNTGAWAGDTTGAAIDTVFGCLRSNATDSQNLNGDMDEIVIWDDELGQDAITALYNSGAGQFHYAHTAVFSIHDSGTAYADAGEDMCFDYGSSTKSNSANSLVDRVELFTGYDSGATPEYETDDSWEEHISRTINSDRYLWRRIGFSSTDRLPATFTSISTDIVVDDNPAGPPQPPSSVRYVLVEDGAYVLFWQEPSDEDFSHCEISRTLGGATTQYLANASGVPTWQASDPSVWFKFSDGTFASGTMPTPSFVDTGVTGAVEYFVRSVDTSENKSEWTTIVRSARPQAPAVAFSGGFN